MKLSAVIFDLNGTILEDEDDYGRAFNKVLKSLGVNTDSPYPHMGGIGVKENWVRFIPKYNIKTTKTVEDLTRETQEAYLIEVSEIAVRPGFNEFLESLKSAYIGTALATSNSWEIATEILRKVGLESSFDAITTEEEAAFNKPDPELFLISADKLGAERDECLVIEDSASGVEAAKRAGMKVIAIARDGEYAKQLEAADLVIEGFSEITPKVLDQL